MVREVEDGKSKLGTRLKEDWNELGVKSIGGWCNKVKDRGWLASKLGEQEGGEREDDAGFEKIEDFNVTSNAEEKFAGATMTSADTFDMTLQLGGEEIWGWIVPAKWRAELGILKRSDDQAKGKMAIQFDNGEEWLGN